MNLWISFQHCIAKGGISVVFIESFDGRGNFSMGIREQLISGNEYDKIDKIRGMDIVFVTLLKQMKKPKL